MNSLTLFLSINILDHPFEEMAHLAMEIYENIPISKLYFPTQKNWYYLPVLQTIHCALDDEAHWNELYSWSQSVTSS